MDNNPFNIADDENLRTYNYTELSKCFGKEGEVTFNYSTKDLIIHARQQNWKIVDMILEKKDDSININATDEFDYSLLYYALKFERFDIAQTIHDKAIWDPEQIEELISTFMVEKNNLRVIKYILDVLSSEIKLKPQNDLGNPARISMITFMLTEAYLCENLTIKQLVFDRMYGKKDPMFPANIADKILIKTICNLVRKGADTQLTMMLEDLKQKQLVLIFDSIDLFAIAVIDQQHQDSGRCLNILKILLKGFSFIENSSFDKDVVQENFNNKFPKAIKHQQEFASLLSNYTLKQAPEIHPELTANW